MDAWNTVCFLLGPGLFSGAFWLVSGSVYITYPQIVKGKNVERVFITSVSEEGILGWGGGLMNVPWFLEALEALEATGFQG